MPKMRTIDQAAEWLRETDPDTALTKTALRRLVVSGQLPHVTIGSKYLIDLDVLAAFLRGEIHEAARSEVGGIRRIAG